MLSHFQKNRIIACLLAMVVFMSISLAIVITNIGAHYRLYTNRYNVAVTLRLPNGYVPRQGKWIPMEPQSGTVDWLLHIEKSNSTNVSIGVDAIGGDFESYINSIWGMTTTEQHTNAQFSNLKILTNAQGSHAVFIPIGDDPRVSSCNLFISASGRGSHSEIKKLLSRIQILDW